MEVELLRVPRKREDIRVQLTRRLNTWRKPRRSLKTETSKKSPTLLPLTKVQIIMLNPRKKITRDRTVRFLTFLELKAESIHLKMSVSLETDKMMVRASNTI